MKRDIPPFVLLILIGFACTEKPSSSKKTSTQEEKVFFLTDSSKTNTTEKRSKVSGLKVLKSMVDQVNGYEQNHSTKIIKTNTIDDFLLIRDLFPIEEIDSIEIYGPPNAKALEAKTIPDNSLLIIYFNHQRLAKNQLNLMRFEWSDRYTAADAFYKKGAITFELDKQLCVYSVNACLNQGGLIERVDSTFKTAFTQHSYHYERTITNCGTVSFEHRVN